MSQLRRRLKQFAIVFGVNLNNLGFNRFRKYVATVLIAGGGHVLAQFVNAHGSVRTTTVNYDIGTRTAVDNTLKSIGGEAVVRRHDRSVVSDAGRYNRPSPGADDFT